MDNRTMMKSLVVAHNLPVGSLRKATVKLTGSPYLSHWQPGPVAKTRELVARKFASLQKMCLTR
jgi:hypothetical protein